MPGGPINVSVWLAQDPSNYVLVTKCKTYMYDNYWYESLYLVQLIQQNSWLIQVSFWQRRHTYHCHLKMAFQLEKVTEKFIWEMSLIPDKRHSSRTAYYRTVDSLFTTTTLFPDSSFAPLKNQTMVMLNPVLGGACTGHVNWGYRHLRVYNCRLEQ